MTNELINIDKNKLIAKHIGIIMDGNRRWAKSKGLKKQKGIRREQKMLKI